MPKRLCIIPASSESKRFPDKLLSPLKGMPLLFHTIGMAIVNFDKVIVSSDSDKIMDTCFERYSEISEMTGILQIDKRPKRLASKEAPVMNTILYYYERMKGFDEIWMLLPTCPLRIQKDIDEVKSLIAKKHVPNVVSITEYEFPPALAFNIQKHGHIAPYRNNKSWLDNQMDPKDHKLFYRPNGCIYASQWSRFDKKRNFYRNTVGYIMPRERSININTKLDLDIADLLIGR